jgi:hypothetical protein
VRRRERWQRASRRFDPTRLVFIVLKARLRHDDETWIKTNMAPIRDPGPKGERLLGFAPDGRWRTLTFLAALRINALTEPCVVDGPINGTIFRGYIEQFLMPTLKPGDIVVLDNLGSHRSRAIRTAVLRAGAKLAFLPPYSPTSTHRAGFREDEALDADGPGAHRRRHPRAHCHSRQRHRADRMRKLPQKRRIRFQLNLKDSSAN